jgi:hypothetical protein
LAGTGVIDDMTRESIEALVVFVGAAVAICCARAWMARTADLKLGIFRPWRGDPWPIGVQEDDDFRFKWTAEARSAVEGSPPAGRPAGREPGPSGADETDRGLIEDVGGDPVSVEHVGRIRVRPVGT